MITVSCSICFAVSKPATSLHITFSKLSFTTPASCALSAAVSLSTAYWGSTSPHWLGRLLNARPAVLRSYVLFVVFISVLLSVLRLLDVLLDLFSPVHVADHLLLQLLLQVRVGLVLDHQHPVVERGIVHLQHLREIRTTRFLLLPGESGSLGVDGLVRQVDGALQVGLVVHLVIYYIL